MGRVLRRTPNVRVNRTLIDRPSSLRAAISGPTRSALTGAHQESRGSSDPMGVFTRVAKKATRVFRRSSSKNPKTAAPTAAPATTVAPTTTTTDADKAAAATTIAAAARGRASRAASSPSLKARPVTTDADKAAAATTIAAAARGRASRTASSASAAPSSTATSRAIIQERRAGITSLLAANEAKTQEANQASGRDIDENALAEAIPGYIRMFSGCMVRGATAVRRSRRGWPAYASSSLWNRTRRRRRMCRTSAPLRSFGDGGRAPDIATIPR